MARNTRDATLEKIPRNLKVLMGSFSGMIATTLVHPLDLMKVKLQIYEKPKTFKLMAQKVVRCAGYRGLFRGLSAALLRQSTYTSSRLSVYYFLFERYNSLYNAQPTLNEKVWFGVWSGVVGALMGNPAEVALVRLMSDGPHGPCCPAGNKRRYGGVFDVFAKVVRKEGVSALWRGGLLTVLRSAFVSVAQIQTYTRARDILKRKDIAKGLKLHLYTSIVTSFFTAFASLPVDSVKTLYQIRTDGMTQRDIFTHMLKSRGILHFWKGFVPYFVRMSFHTFITFCILEQLCHVYRHYSDKPID